MNTVLTFKSPAGSNYATSFGRIVRLSGTGKEVTICTDASVLPLGIIVSADDRNGGNVAVCIQGECRARAGNNIVAGTNQALQSNGSGECVPGVAGSFVVGRFMGAASAVSGDEINVVVAPFELET